MRCLAITTLLFCQTLFAEEVRLFVANEHTKPITVVKEDGKQYRLSPGQDVTGHFRIGSHVENYIDGKLVCTWYISSYQKEHMKGLVYGWVGSHPSVLDCSVLYN